MQKERRHGGPLAVDVLAVHPVAPSKPRDPSKVLDSFKRQENKKNLLYEDKCNTIGWSFCPLAMHLWGGYGPQGGALMNKLIRHIVGDTQGWRKVFKAQHIRHRLGVVLMKAVAAQLLTAKEAILEARHVISLPLASRVQLPKGPKGHGQARKRAATSPLDGELGVGGSGLSQRRRM